MEKRVIEQSADRLPVGGTAAHGGAGGQRVGELPE